MRTLLNVKILFVFVFVGFLPGLLFAQPTLQDTFMASKNIFLLVSADQLWQASNENEPVVVEDYCALQDNAGVMKYGSETKDQKLAIEVLAGDEITWSGKVDPFSRCPCTTSTWPIAPEGIAKIFSSPVC